MKNVHKRKYISVNEMNAHTNWDFWRDRHSYRSRQEGNRKRTSVYEVEK